MDVWGQLLLDAAASDPAGLIHGDVAALKYVRNRVLGAIDRADLTELDQLIHDLAEAAAGPDGAAVTTTTTAAMLDTVAAIRPVS
jgi:hypothetical protein